jgi:hypothetical protein
MPLPSNFHNDPHLRDLSPIEAIPFERTATQPHNNIHTQHVPELDVVACFAGAERLETVVRRVLEDVEGVDYVVPGWY